ncbi:MAG: polysaccharide deacetylase family protein [Candidatus Hydrogenedentota bacterium]|nr:MAG: polysaccharide deacetylase family protein [Candidatus Hydrogenedentota bacterium]
MSRIRLTRIPWTFAFLLIFSFAPSTSPAERGVEVTWSGPTDVPRVAVTFDDGPDPRWTPRVLDILSYADAHATFFVLGERVEGNEKILKRMLDEGHEIGSHGFHHHAFTKLSSQQRILEISMAGDAIEKGCGVPPVLFRPPGGSISFSVLRDLSRTDVELVVMWSIDPKDWMKPGERKIWERIGREVEPGSIILLHDTHRSTVEALPVLLDLLQARGFDLVTVSDLLERNYR